MAKKEKEYKMREIVPSRAGEFDPVGLGISTRKKEALASLDKVLEHFEDQANQAKRIIHEMDKLISSASPEVAAAVSKIQDCYKLKKTVVKVFKAKICESAEQIKSGKCSDAEALREALEPFEFARGAASGREKFSTKAIASLQSIIGGYLCSTKEESIDKLVEHSEEIAKIRKLVKCCKEIVEIEKEYIKNAGGEACRIKNLIKQAKAEAELASTMPAATELVSTTPVPAKLVSTTTPSTELVSMTTSPTELVSMTTSPAKLVSTTTPSREFVSMTIPSAEVMSMTSDFATTNDTGALMAGVEGLGEGE